AEGRLRVALDPVAKKPKPLPEYQSALPPANWLKADFDDSAWDRQWAPVELHPGGATGRKHAARHTATVNSLICLRAKVGVTDPSKAVDMKLSLEYVGGVVVYLNGREIARGHMPAGEIKPETLAEKYPDDLYREPDGLFLQKVAKNPEGFKRRYRRLDATVPRKLLRKGTNVLILEIHRAPVNEGAVKAKRIPVGGMYVVPGIWAYAGLQSLRLTSESAAGVIANVARPKGVQVWNVAPFETISAFRYGDPGEALNPITVHAARNSVFSGRLAVSSDKAINGLKVAVSDLKPTDGTGTLPASAVQVRYAAPAVRGKSWAPPHRFDALLGAVPAGIPVIQARPPRGARTTRSTGAVASLWFTVRTPATAEAGQYEGTVTVKAEGLSPTQVPLRVTVHRWTMPAPKDFRQHHLICVSPQSLAKHYKVPLWSKRHFELMGRSLSLLAEVNSREIPINLAIDFYGRLSNLDTLVRWIKRKDGTYGHDFSVFDRYLDLVAKHCGKPLPVRLNCWGEIGRDGKNQSGPDVSLLDPASGEIKSMPQPLYGTQESYQFWKPVIEKALSKLKARGWLDVTALGHNSYCYSPKRPTIDVAKKLWPEG
ncbi:hypothetical protein LCGC14_2257650, partial [marine sediment metagenome]